MLRDESMALVQHCRRLFLHCLAIRCARILAVNRRCRGCETRNESCQDTRKTPRAALKRISSRKWSNAANDDSMVAYGLDDLLSSDTEDEQDDSIASPLAGRIVARKPSSISFELFFFWLFPEDDAVADCVDAEKNQRLQWVEVTELLELLDEVE